MIHLFKKEKIKEHWRKELPLIFNNIKYRVGRMSYGDYFLEPGNGHKEIDDFTPGTLWLEKFDKHNFKIQ